VQKIIALVVLLVGLQSAKEFEVASIRPADQNIQVTAGVAISGSQVRISNLSLKDFVGIAYGVRVNQVVGPEWIDSLRFTIAAKLPDGAAPSDVNPMLQNLLVDRFKMRTHREMKELPVYLLQVAESGLNVAETVPDGDALVRGAGAMNMVAGGSNGAVAIDFGEGSSFALSPNAIEIRKLTMATVAEMLTRFLDRPVVDRTSLKGGYDLKLELTQADAIAMMVRSAVTAGVVLPPQALALLDSGSAYSLSSSLKKAGLTLEATRMPLDVVVVDEMQKTPTEN
jgi:uncharacterized protein (TIGR03435 family)